MSTTRAPTKANGNSSEQVYHQLRQRIERGELKPGMRLIQRDLARLLKTSNIPIVEAIRRLEHDGLVISTPNRGAQVVDWSIDEMESAVMIRSSLEQLAARLCASRASEEQRSELKALAETFRQCAKADDLNGCQEADAALHTLIVNCSGSRLLTQLLDKSRVITNTILRTTWLPVAVSRPDVHDALVDAIVSRNEDIAEAEARKHVETLLSHLRRAARDCGLRPQ